ncbi:uncharacterized protein LOC122614427 [Drosophila teissieri]|uniref:uncharacterized protein LOC122614427 n=1 Tax=Drosophila teissieri TaxID=7243 RepID=UPI001CBA029C|nr:uncharacterized protein LOC122614427 [Drosophila teissieri]
MYLCQQLWLLLLWLCFAFLSVHGMPYKWGPASNSGPHGGPAWNGGDSTDNIVIYSKKTGNWRY